MTPQKFVSLHRIHGGVRAVSRAADVDYKTVNTAYKKAVALGLLDYIPMGRKPKMTVKHVTAKQRVKSMRTKRMVPSKGASKRYILTSAQNNTNVHDGTWLNILALAKHYDAQIMVSEFLYYKRAVGQSRNDKAQLTMAGVKKSDQNEIWYDARIIPYVCNQRVEIAKGLVFCGELNILPTAEKPLRGLEVYTGRKSMIIPHTKQDMDSIATVGGSGAKLNYCTGTVTLRNYIQRKEGFKGEFHHCYGGLIVEVDEEGHWWVRQLNADSEGTIYDWDLCAKDGRVTSGHRIEALTAGDVHVAQIDETVESVVWGEGGVVDQTNPKEVHIHDVLDFYARGHWTIKDPFKRFKRFVQNREDVRAEVEEVASFLNSIHRKDTRVIVIDSNHDRHLTRWLKENDGREDPVNAEFWIELHGIAYDYIRTHKREPLLLREVLKGSVDAEFIDCNTSHVICNTTWGGIECSLHGDKGANGARATLSQFAKMGRRSNTGHGHSAGISGGAFRSGTFSKLQLEYNDGLSSWSHSFIMTYPNGKRTIVTIFAGKARA